ncbi:RNA polymerase sigma-70 factor, ECF subfamily [Pseudonocardia ammonioxydans]|uniref:RNA polymerase sigma-70 factor, ECF subfamily n=1 Tax=Pseudonocardia ammonioxydans TaxID=260086 RepID=A0A1I5ACT3_PSUAM|nr:RNA polymerase sigma-70 factor, ECF subfamily [Pseudonocardia ammonioxydans]
MMIDGSAVLDPLVPADVGNPAEQQARRASPAGADLLPPELLRAAVAGDQRAVALLLARVQPQVERFCRARLGRRETTLGSADDVAQDVCMAVLSVLPDYRLSGMSFRAFVFGIARHKIADAFRAMARNRCDAVEEIPERFARDDDPEQVVIDAERNERLADLLGILGPRQIEILTLRIAVGLSAEETADALGSTPGAVRVAQHRALQRLRRDLDERAERRAARLRDQPPVPARPGGAAGPAPRRYRPAATARTVATVPAPRGAGSTEGLPVAV